MPGVRWAATPQFDPITIEDGLSHGTVWSILQDRRGFLWFATAGGLNRYDGYEFEVYLHDPEDPNSLAESIVLHLLEDREGTLWLGTRGRGVNRFDPATETLQHFEEIPGDSNSLLGTEVWVQLQDRSGDLWFGTEAGLSRLDPATGTFTRYRHDPEDPRSLGLGLVNRIFEDSRGQIWIGLEGGGLARYDAVDDGFSHYRHDPEDPSSLPNDGVGALLEDREGRLWVGTWEGLAWKDPEAEDLFHRYPLAEEGEEEDSVITLWESSSGEIWVGMSATGLRRITLGDGTTENQRLALRQDPEDPTGLVSDSILSFYEDRTGILWIGTRAGISRYDPRSNQFSRFRPAKGLSRARVWAIEQDSQGVIWGGTMEGGLVRLDQEKGTLEPHGLDGPFAELSPQAVASLLEDRAGFLWIGTEGEGLLRLGPDRKTLVTYLPDPLDPNSLAEDSAYCLLEDPDGALWIGTYESGIQRLDEERRVFTNFQHDPDDPHSLISNDVYDLYIDRAGDLWVGSFGGLHHLRREDFETGHFTRYVRELNDPNSLSSNNVTSILEDSSGVLWVGTTGGLHRLGPERQHFRFFGARSGLPHEKIVSLAEGDGGELWIASVRGLSRFDPASETFTNYDTRDGLHGNVFFIGSAIQGLKGELFFGGERGVTSLIPGQIEQDPHPPQVLLTEFLLYNEPARLRRQDPSSPLERPIEVTDELRLTHREKVIGFEFSALHYAAPPKNRYAYRLKGFEDDWIPTDASRRFAFYTNLEAGTYTFEVKGSNKDGVWSDEVASVRLRVAPPPWKSWWAYLLYTLALGTVMSSVVLGQRRELRRERALAARERAINRQLRELDKRKDELVAEKSSRIKILEGILPICATCKKIRDKAGQWNDLEVYIDQHSEAEFSHGVCPDCLASYLAPKS